MFDAEKVLLEQDVFRSPYTIAYSAAGAGKGIVVLTDIENDITIKDTLLTLSVAGTTDAIVVADVVIVFEDDTQASLTVQLPH